MIALAAAPVVEDPFAAVRVAHRREPLGHLPDRGVPADLLELAVGPPPQRRGQPVTAVLVVVEPEGLVAGVSLRGRVRLVTADARQVAAIQLHLDAAVALAQDARRLLPAVLGHGGRAQEGATTAVSRSPRAISRSCSNRITWPPAPQLPSATSCISTHTRSASCSSI